MKRVLVTGATGFVGRALCPDLARAGYAVRALVRAGRPAPPGTSECVVVDDIGAATDWQAALDAVDFIVHLAAQAHVVTTTSMGASAAMRTNAYATDTLATAAARAGVRRFVYLSTVKVNGEETTVRPFTGEDEPRPADPYARSKWLGEKLAAEASRAGNMPLAIVRAPLIYGPEVRANFLQLMHWVDRGWPLPFGAVKNSRSLVGIWNVTDLLTRLLEHPGAPGHIFMVSDGKDLSTAELIRGIGRALGRHPRLVPVPDRLLRSIGQLSGRGEQFKRLCRSLAVDIESTCNLLGWAPPIATDEGFERTANWYRTRFGS
jgi:nucleoside-diphosphate-sugar epimerase